MGDLTARVSILETAKKTAEEQEAKCREGLATLQGSYDALVAMKTNESLIVANTKALERVLLVLDGRNGTP